MIPHFTMDVGIVVSDGHKRNPAVSNREYENNRYYVERLSCGHIQREELIAKFPYAKGFINRTYEWLGPVSKLSRIQKLIMEWILLPFEFWTNYSMTSPST